MREIGSDTWGVDHIIQGKLGDKWGGLEEEGQWLLRELLATIPTRNVRLEGTYLSNSPRGTSDDYRG